jgi:hypothetical protein
MSGSCVEAIRSNGNRALALWKFVLTVAPGRDCRIGARLLRGLAGYTATGILERVMELRMRRESKNPLIFGARSFVVRLVFETLLTSAPSKCGDYWARKIELRAVRAAPICQPLVRQWVTTAPPICVECQNSQKSDSLQLSDWLS